MSDERDIDSILKEFNASTESAPQQPAAVEHILTPENLTHSLASLTKMLARKLDMPEIALTPDDEEDLTNALKPFADKLDLLIKYLPYLPLGIFAAGYSIRVYSGVKRKSDEKKASKIANRDKAAQAIAKEKVDAAQKQDAEASKAAAEKEIKGGQANEQPASH